MRVGHVWLVGAGPGDPGLMTVRGLEALRGADVVVYDRLINPTLLNEAPAEAIRIYAGKLTESHGLSQEDINVLLIAHARRGRSVVRLKGGDPFVFGRGGEEAEALAASAIPFEVVPGVSAAVAVPAYAGIPLTHRRLASSFAVVTGHEDATRGGPHVDWSRLATAVDTLVILMGARSLPRIAATLVSCGRAPSTPVALIRWGTTEAQETMTCTLGDLADPQAALDLRPPLVTVIGDVVSLRDQLRWFDEEAGRTFDLAGPEVALPSPDANETETIELDVAVVAATDVPEEDRFAVAVVRRLCESARTRDGAAAVVEPVSSDVPGRDLRHVRRLSSAEGRSVSSISTISASPSPSARSAAITRREPGAAEPGYAEDLVDLLVGASLGRREVEWNFTQCPHLCRPAMRRPIISLVRLGSVQGPGPARSCGRSRGHDRLRRPD